MMKKYIEVAVLGQPNVGKSTLFNILTGKKVRVANWPGVTVEIHEGERIHRGHVIKFVDLPGIYGFSTTTIEERIARKYILSRQPDVVLVLVDGLNPERTMYLLIQTLEITPNVVVAITKYDVVHAHGIHINYKALEHKLGVPVIPVSATSMQGIMHLLDVIIDVAEGRKGRRDLLEVDYKELNVFIESVMEVLEKLDTSKIGFPKRWMAIRLLEGDPEIEGIVKRTLGEEALNEIINIREEIKRIYKRDPAELFSSRRFEYINELLKGIIIRASVEAKHKFITKYFYHPVAGPLISTSILLAVFIFAFTINTGFPFDIILEELGYHEIAVALEEYSIGGLMEKGFSILSGFLYKIMGESMSSHLLIDGIIGGVGAVLAFLPLIMVISLMLAILEDSGLAPRIAVGLHSLLNKIGVSGHAVFPIILGFGCNVPSIMATRAIPSLRERMRLIMTLPFIPCQARLVVILAFASALKGLNGALLILYGYVLAFIVFAIINRLLYEYDKKKGVVVEPDILLELPPIHKPILRVIWWHVWDSAKHFLIKAGTIIFVLSILIWFMTSYTPELTYTDDVSNSIAAGIAKVFAPILSPLNMSENVGWIIAFALLMGFIAKEAVVGSLTILTEANSAREAIRLLGLIDSQIAAITVFTILYVPCLATLAVIYFESRSWKVALLTILIMMSVAYIGMLITYFLSLII
ncbi:MAG: ferrous iron transport protein B [Staphylothermus sp.]|nr:ferrous iron transport protein B [Staphylothermus sp.]